MRAINRPIAIPWIVVLACVSFVVAPQLAEAAPNRGTASGANPSTKAVFRGVAMVSSTDVWAVGQAIDPKTNLRQTLIERWDGAKWYVVPSPNATQDDYLIGVAAVSRNDVWAVGGDYNLGPTSTLIEHWDGASWTIVPGAKLYRLDHELYAVSSDAAGAAWAVGGPLIEHWNRKRWLTVAEPPQTNNTLGSVAAESPHDIWAVGYTNEFGGLPLIEHSSGNGWTIVAGPTPTGGYLSGVAALSASDAWAVGNVGQGGFQTLTEHWDGTQWSIILSPNTLQYSRLTSVTALASNDVWAAGFAFGSGSTATLTEHWDGSQWIVVPSPNPNSTCELLAIAAISTDDVWAVGYRYQRNKTLTEHWNGAQWVVVPSPN
jgi:hypothetical protein